MPQSSSLLKKITLFSLMIITALAAGGCTRKKDNVIVDSSGKSEIFIWRATEYKDLFRPYAVEYMKKNSKVQLWYTQKDQDNFEATTVNQIAADLKPQVWSIPVDWMPDNIDKLLPMPDGILGKGIDNAKFMKDKLITGISDDVYKSYTRNGKVYGLPFTIDSLIVYYNPRLFREAFDRWLEAHPRGVDNQPTEEEVRIQKLLEKPPATWQDLLEIIPLLTIRQGNDIKQSAIALGTADNINNADDIAQLLIYQNGGDIVSNDENQDKVAVFKNTKEKENGEIFNPGINALAFYSNFSNPQKATYTWNKSMSNAIDAFVHGKVAMIIDYPTLREKLNKEYPETFPDPYLIATAQVMQISKTQEPVNFGNYTIEVVTKAAQINNKVTSAWAWILSYMKTESSQGITETIKRPSPHKSITEARAVMDGGIISKQALTVRVPYKRQHAKFDATFLTMIRNITDKSQPVDDAIIEANDKINKLLQTADQQ